MRGGMISHATALASPMSSAKVIKTDKTRERKRQVFWKKLTTGANIQAMAQAAKKGMSTGLSQRKPKTRTVITARNSRPRIKRSKSMTGFRKSM